MRSLDGKTVVITGAASGLGRALALAAAARGARLALSDVAESGLAETAELAERHGSRAVSASRLDVADRAAYREYAAEVVERFGGVDVLVNNAGVALSGDLTELTYEDLEWIVGVNLWGVVHGTKEFLPHLIASGDGHLVTMSSLFGLVSVPGQSAYNATKYAVRGLTEAVREEMLVAGHRVGVTVVHPGGVRTSIARNARHPVGVDAEERARLFEERWARMEPDHAAELVWKGVLAGKPRVLVGVDAHLTHHLARLLGARYQDVLAAAARRDQAET